ncbi:PIG-L deacetylase family protein [Microbacterium sp. MPKO10]|uniref:PIG-L deacetylase family protein n=1 Tax=Microbacterium sp. MPKO10 TaxID=2989818 RepID=UPI0022354FC3|nr:PIG-L deacetylase family protein [Microbacterium sp. MPKO10]MCW4458861.1 PIG-L family deacetylase [Microbacterium sp. MPKO10]
MSAHLNLDSGPVTVLAVGAHPDDIEIGCGGALLSLRGRGDADVRTLVLTGTEERRAEACHGAQLFGVSQEPTLPGFPDARLPAHWAAVKDALHDFRDRSPVPDVVFVPRADDAHQDHALIGALAPSVWRGPLLLHYEIPKWDGDLGRPNTYLPIADDVAAEKVAHLCEAFPSQHARAWWDEEFFLSIMRIRGAEASTRYAEAFAVSKLTISL